MLLGFQMHFNNVRRLSSSLNADCMRYFLEPILHFHMFGIEACAGKIKETLYQIESPLRVVS
jgi:hypothetical protein